MAANGREGSPTANGGSPPPLVLARANQNVKQLRKEFRQKTQELQREIELHWRPPQESKRLTKRLQTKKASITRVAEELDALKQDLSEPHKQRINALLNLIDRAVPILPKQQATVVPMTVQVKEEPNL